MHTLIRWSWLLLTTSAHAAMAASPAAGISVAEPHQPPALLMLDGPQRTISAALLPAGDEWLGLACDEQACALWPARMTVDPEKISGERLGYRDSGTHHLLSFVVDGIEPDRVIAWFHRDEALPWLRPGVLPSAYPAGAHMAQIGGAGDFEVELQLPVMPVQRLIPVYDTTEGMVERIRLRLRAGNSWQWLGVLQVCNEGMDLRYLRWAGDLDGDGIGDWLIDFGLGTDAPLRLFLSSRAESGRIVSEAGRSGSQARQLDCAPW